MDEGDLFVVGVSFKNIVSKPEFKFFGENSFYLDAFEYLVYGLYKDFFIIEVLAKNCFSSFNDGSFCCNGSVINFCCKLKG